MRGWPPPRRRDRGVQPECGKQIFRVLQLLRSTDVVGLGSDARSTRRPGDDLTRTHHQLAASAQRVFEDVTVAILTRMYERAQLGCRGLAKRSRHDRTDSQVVSPRRATPVVGRPVGGPQQGLGLGHLWRATVSTGYGLQSGSLHFIVADCPRHSATEHELWPSAAGVPLASPHGPVSSPRDRRRSTPEARCP